MKLIGLTQRVEDLPARRERRDCLDQAWTGLLLDNGFWPVPLPNRVGDTDKLLTLLGLSGVILTGGNDLGAAPERDAFENSLLESCARAKVPVLGVCRGLELMNAHYGGRLEPVSGHAAVTHELSPVPGAKVPFMRARVNSYHGFGIPGEALAADLAAAAFAPDGTVEAAAHRSLPQWGIMWHPERGPREADDARLLKALFS